MISRKFSILCTDDGIKSEKLLLNIIFKPLVFDLPGTTTFIISNEEMNDIMKIVTSLEGSGLSIKGVSKTIKN